MVFEPDLLKLLKGKSCFHIKKIDDKLIKQMKKALDIGYNLYNKRGWIKKKKKKFIEEYIMVI